MNLYVIPEKTFSKWMHPTLSTGNDVAFTPTLSDQSNQPDVNMDSNLLSSSPPSSSYNPHSSILAHNQFDLALPFTIHLFCLRTTQ